MEVAFGIPFFVTAEDAEKMVFNQIKLGHFGNNLRRNTFLHSLGKVRLCLEMEMMSEERNCVTLHQSRRNRFDDPIAEFQFSIWDQEYLSGPGNSILSSLKKLLKMWEEL